MMTPRSAVVEEIQVAEELAERAVAPRRRRIPGGGLARVPWYFVVPAAAFFLFVTLVPSLRGLYFGFTDWRGTSVVNLTGLNNFVAFFKDSQAIGALWHTLLLSALITVIQVALGLALALAVNSRIRSRNVLRVFFFAPAVVLPIAVAFLWQYLFAPTGPINQLLAAIGLEALQQNWLGDPNVALVSIAITVIWQFSGYSMVIFLANLQSIDESVIEASHLDGAGAFQRFWYVIRPELGPSVVINVMLTLTSSLKLFDQVWAMTKGGPGNATETMSTYMYRVTFSYTQFGYGTTIAIILALVVVIISTVQFRIFARGARR